MMPGLGEFSEGNLKTCDYRLQNIVRRASGIYEVRVLCGRRSNAQQAYLQKLGRTHLGPGESKHNPQVEYAEDDNGNKLVHAVDVVPYPIDWRDAKRFIYLAGIMMGLAALEGVVIRWGGNWDMDMVIIDDQNFDDLPHFELVT